MKYSVLLKIWLAYPLFCYTCILISVDNDRVFNTKTYDVTDESVEWRTIWNGWCF